MASTWLRCWVDFGAVSGRFWVACGPIWEELTLTLSRFGLLHGALGVRRSTALLAIRLALTLRGGWGWGGGVGVGWVLAWLGVAVWMHVGV